VLFRSNTQILDLDIARGGRCREHGATELGSSNHSGPRQREKFSTVRFHILPFRYVLDSVNNSSTSSLVTENELTLIHHCTFPAHARRIACPAMLLSPFDAGGRDAP